MPNPFALLRNAIKSFFMAFNRSRTIMLIGSAFALSKVSATAKKNHEGPENYQQLLEANLIITTALHAHALGLQGMTITEGEKQFCPTGRTE